MVEESNTVPSNWFARHKIATILIVIVLLGIIGAATGHKKSKPPVVQATNSTNAPTSFTFPTEAPTPTPIPTWGDGTYEVGRDIPTGTYVANGTNCFWAITSDANGTQPLGSNYGSGQQIVNLDTPGTFFKVERCPFVARS